MEILFLLLFVPFPLFLYYFASKGKMIRSIYLNVGFDTILEQIYNELVSECFNGLQYKDGEEISSEIYDKGKYEKYDKYYSYDKIEGILNNKNKIELSYVGTSRGSIQRDDFCYIFRGYFIRAELNKPTKLQIKRKENRIFRQQSFIFRN